MTLQELLDIFSEEGFDVEYYESTDMICIQNEKISLARIRFRKSMYLSKDDEMLLEIRRMLEDQNDIIANSIIEYLTTPEDKR